MFHSPQRYLFEEFVTDTLVAETPGALLRLLARAVAPYGYERVIFAVFNDPELPVMRYQLGFDADDFDAWNRYYDDNRLWRSDPIIRALKLGAGPFTWEGLPEIFTFDRTNHQFLHLLGDFGMYNGATISLDKRGAALGLTTANANEAPDAHLPVLNAIGNQFYEAYKAMIKGPPVYPTPILTRRESDILAWVAAGKTDDEIGVIMSISHNTVDTHLRHIFRKLDANSRVTAVVKGLTQGLITV